MLTPPIHNTFISIIAILFSQYAFARTDHTDIEISHTYEPYVSLTGTAVGAVKFYDNDDIVTGTTPIWNNLGTMGVESNIGGNCDLSFSSDNNFTLLHTTNTATGGVTYGAHSLGAYSLRYGPSNTIFGNLTNIQSLTLSSCNTTPTDIDFKLDRTFTRVATDGLIRAGIYQDVVNIVVTTQ